MFHARFLLLAGIASVPALLALGGHDACAQQLSLINTRGLDFGRFVAGSGGTVTISPTGLRSRTGGVILLNSPSAGPASFTVSKSSIASAGGPGVRGSAIGGNNAVVISLPANGSTRLSSGSNSMALNAFIDSPTTMLSVTSTGTTLSVGATLIVAPNQAPGNYSGSVPLIVNFQ